MMRDLDPVARTPLAENRAHVSASNLGRVIAAVGVMAVCSLGSCGDNKTECEKACDKLRSCAENLQCDQADPAAKARCESAKTAAAEEACGMSECTVYVEALAKEFNACTLDPQTCDCQDTSDGGPPDECENANEKMKRCLEALDCARLTGSDQTACEVAQLAGQSAFVGICAGDLEAEAKAFNACTLDPAKCRCPAAGGS